MKKNLENTFSAEKYFFMKNKFHQLVQADSLDFSGSNNPKGGNHESNRAKEERNSIKFPGFFI